MATSFGALCTDFYVNQKLGFKMDLPTERDTVLHLFDQVRKSVPSMTKFRRYEGELSLESPRREGAYQWLAQRRASVRTGVVNPESMEQAYALHRLVLEAAPYQLTTSPLDIDSIELLLGFDLECGADHDEIVFEALFAQSPMADLLQVEGGKLMDMQPVFGFNIGDAGDTQATFEVKTRERTRRGSNRSAARDEPITVFVTVRRHGPITDLKQLPVVGNELIELAERLATDQLVPELLTPIAQHITPRSL